MENTDKEILYDEKTKHVTIINRHTTNNYYGSNNRMFTNKITLMLLAEKIMNNITDNMKELRMLKPSKNYNRKALDYSSTYKDIEYEIIDKELLFSQSMDISDIETISEFKFWKIEKDVKLNNYQDLIHDVNVFFVTEDNFNIITDMFIPITIKEAFKQNYLKFINNVLYRIKHDGDYSSFTFNPFISFDEKLSKNIFKNWKINDELVMYCIEDNECLLLGIYENQIDKFKEL